MWGVLGGVWCASSSWRIVHEARVLQVAGSARAGSAAAEAGRPERRMDAVRVSGREELTSSDTGPSKVGGLGGHLHEPHSDGVIT